MLFAAGTRAGTQGLLRASHRTCRLTRTLLPR
jgi:hypothetical protein